MRTAVIFIFNKFRGQGRVKETCEIKDQEASASVRKEHRRSASREHHFPNKSRSFKEVGGGDGGN